MGDVKTNYNLQITDAKTDSEIIHRNYNWNPLFQADKKRTEELRQQFYTKEQILFTGIGHKVRQM